MKNSAASSLSLVVNHCAGMIDMVALPVWVGAVLIGSFEMAPREAGLLVTLFLTGQVVASLSLAPRFGALPVRFTASCGLAIAALAFFGMYAGPDYTQMMLLHLIGGLGAGAALSVTHGLMGKTANPHRLFAIAGVSIGVTGIAILGAGPAAAEHLGGATVFLIFGGFMCVALVLTLLFMKPVLADKSSESVDTENAPRAPLPTAVWFTMVGLGTMALSNSMVFSFVERIGMDRDYGLSAVTTVLIAVGFFNLLPPIVAAIFERKFPVQRVLLAGPLVQLGLVLLLTLPDSLATYAVAAALWIGVMLFTHTFVFGLLARLDSSGRAVASTPAMLMIGSAIGPLAGGALVQLFGYQSLAVAVLITTAGAVFCFWQVRQQLRAQQQDDLILTSEDIGKSAVNGSAL